MSVKVDATRFVRSNYVHPERVVPKCGVCGCRIRGKNHEQGNAHITKAKAK